MKRIKISMKQIYTAVDIILILLAMAALCLACEYDKKHEKTAAETRISLEGEYSLNGGAYQPLTEDLNPGVSEYNTLNVRGHFTDDIPENMQLMIRLSNVVISLRINGKEIYHTRQDESAYSRSPGNGWAAIPSCGITRDDDVEYIISNVYRNGNPQTFVQALKEMYVSYEGDMARWVIGGYTSSLLFGIITIPLGLILLFTGIVIPQIDRERIFSLSLFSIASGMWILIDPNYMSFFSDRMQFMMALYQIFQLLQIVAITKFAYTIVRGTGKKIIGMLHDAGLLLFAAATVGQIAGWFDYYDFTYVDIVLIYVICVVIPIVFIWESGGKNQLARKALISMLPLALFTVAEQIMYHLGNYYDGFSTKAGFTIFLAIQAVYTVKEARQLVKRVENAALLEKELAESQMNIMISQIQPHFLYNALNTIQYLCENDPKLAGKTVGNFSKYLRGNMDSVAYKKPIPLSQELAHLEEYLAIEKLRFDDVEVIFHIEAEGFLLPALTIQPIVENAIRHGVALKEHGGTVTVSTYEDEQNWYIEISDNGNGFATSGLPEDGRSHIGIENTRQRIHTMCEGTLEIQSNPGIGTTVKITIPKENGGTYESSRS